MAAHGEVYVLVALGMNGFEYDFEEMVATSVGLDPELMRNQFGSVIAELKKAGVVEIDGSRRLWCRLREEYREGVFNFIRNTMIK